MLFNASCRIIAGLLVGAIGTRADSADEIPRTAAFTLQAEASVGGIAECAVLWGNGWIQNEAVDKTNVPTTITGGIPVNRYRWTAAGFRFTPTGEGWAVLQFHHPETGSNTSRASRGAIAIDHVRATGTTINNPEMDMFADDRPAAWHWSCGQGYMTNAHPTPTAGKHCVVLPPGGGLQQSIHLRAGLPVVIRFDARALMPPDYPEMPRLPDADTPAHAALRHFRRGMNLGNNLEAPPDANWNSAYSAADFDAIRDEGFDHVRIPCAWHHYTGPAPEFIISPDFFARVDNMVSNAVQRNLAVIINWHHFDDFTAHPAVHQAKFERGWAQIANHYARQPGRVALEPLNEPKDAADATTLNHIYARIITIIRKVAPKITLFIGPAERNSVAQLDNLQLPADDANIIVTIHDYDPFLFTHQGASWTMPLTAVTNIHFPGPGPQPIIPPSATPPWARRWFQAYNSLPSEFNSCGPGAINEALLTARAWSDYHGRPVHVGEWGCIDLADAASRAKYLKLKRQRMDDLNVFWTFWNWKQAQFHYWDEERQAPTTGLRPALMDQ